MKKRLFIFFSTLCLLFIVCCLPLRSPLGTKGGLPFIVPSTLAQGANCEVCGLCENNNPPTNWYSCASCLYPADSLPTISADPQEALKIAPTIFSGQVAQDKSYTVFGCISTSQSGFVEFFTNFLSSLVTGLAILGMIFGGLKVMLSHGDKEALEEGKRYIYASIAGLLIVFFAVFIVKIIGSQILKIPFMGE